MNKNLFLIACSLLFCTHAPAQTPGGITASNTLWLKANVGVATSGGNNTAVTQWNEQSGAGITGNFSTQSAATIGMSNTQNPPTYISNGINFNPQLTFNSANTNSISSNNVFPGTQMIDPVNNSLLQVINLRNMNGTTGVFFKWQFLNTNSQRLGCETNGGANLGKMRFDFRGLTTFSGTNIFNKYYLTHATTNATNATIRLNGATDGTNNFVGSPAFAPTENARLTLGNEEYGDPYPTNIDIAEVILFNTLLSAADMNKVESYLAVKYGMTLNQANAYANNYTSSQNSVTWDHYANITYANNITGIGRDDASGLQQNQSKSINAGTFVTVYNGAFNGTNFPVLNTDNTTSFTADNSFLLFGDNNLGLTLSVCDTGNPGIIRIARVWKFQETGTINTVTLAAATASLPVGTATLLVSPDSTFPSANTTIYMLDTSNGTLSSSVTLPANGFFTFGADSLVMTAASNSPVCAGGTIMLAGTTITTGTTYQWTGPNSFTSTDQNPVITDAPVVDSGLYVLSGTFNGCPAAPDTILVAVNTNPVPIVVTPVIYCQYDSAASLAQSATGQNLLWYTDPPSGPGSPTAPTPLTLIPDTTTFYVSQTIGSCVSDSVPISVIVKQKPSLQFNISDTQICLFNTTALTYTGNASDYAQYNWALPADAALVSGNGAGPLVVRFNAAGVSQVTFNVIDNGCASNDTALNITVIKAPAPTITYPLDVCYGQAATVSFDDTSATSNSDLYYWGWDGGTVTDGNNAGPYTVTWYNAGDHIISLSVVVNSCASDTTKDTIHIHPLPDVQITPLASDDVCAGDSLLLQASTTVPVYAYQWYPYNYFQTDNNKQAVYGIIDTPGYVYVRAVSPYSCVNTDSLFLNTHSCCDVVLPNAFTPNNDGHNDIFRIIGLRPQKVVDFRVFNRWGNIVYNATDEKGWDGTSNGVALPMDTYYYNISYICNDGREYHKKGNVTIVR